MTKTLFATVALLALAASGMAQTTSTFNLIALTQPCDSAQGCTNEPFHSTTPQPTSYPWAFVTYHLDASTPGPVSGTATIQWGDGGANQGTFTVSISGNITVTAVPKSTAFITTLTATFNDGAGNSGTLERSVYSTGGSRSRLLDEGGGLYITVTH